MSYSGKTVSCGEAVCPRRWKLQPSSEWNRQTEWSQHCILSSASWRGIIIGRRFLKHSVLIKKQGQGCSLHVRWRTCGEYSQQSKQRIDEDENKDCQQHVSTVRLWGAHWVWTATVRRLMYVLNLVRYDVVCVRRIGRSATRSQSTSDIVFRLFEKNANWAHHESTPSTMGRSHSHSTGERGLLGASSKGSL